MSGALIIILAGLRLASTEHNYTGDESYYQLPRFWTSTGFCPAGKIEHEAITNSLFSDAVSMQMRQIAALPEGAVTHIRIHWLLELIKFVQYTQSGIPIYDLTDLDRFLMNLDDLGLRPVIEFMANPGDVFINNPLRNEYLWRDFSYQVVKHYLNLFGAKTVLSWRFETWNEPDLASYNRLNFKVDDFFTYITAVKQGMTAAGRRTVNSLYFPLRGPAGLFKNEEHHPLCWDVLRKCNLDFKECPIDILTYHRKGNGSNASVLMESTSSMLQEIHLKYPNVKALPISNDEADPIVRWSTPQDFHEDVRYAAVLVTIVLLHWQAKLKRDEFKMLESISHDNAFLSYHPYEFSQRTMLAHFRMNQTQPPHSQFIQKPVYSALGFLSKLGPFAAALEKVSASNNQTLLLLKTTVADNQPLYMSWLILPEKIDLGTPDDIIFKYKLPFTLCEEETYAYIVEILEQTVTDPSYIWRMHNKPAYPDPEMREEMRRRQTPKLNQTDVLQTDFIELALGKLNNPFIVLLRVCSNLMSNLKKPQKLDVVGITKGEVLITLREAVNSTRCLKTYEIWYQVNSTSDWNWISRGWHLPFPNFQYAPSTPAVNGFYKARGLDIFNRYSPFSDPVEYFEIL